MSTDAPIPTASGQARHFDDYWRGVSGWTPNDSFDAELARWMAPLVQKETKLLDVGCGDGSRYAAHLISAGVELHGVDVSAVAVEAAARHGVIARQIGEDGRLPYADGQFDSAMCLEVFQHLFDPEAAAKEIFRVLRPGGLVLASVPNVANWRSRADMVFLGRARTGGSPLNSRYPWRDPHLRMFNSKAIAQMLQDAGFQIQRRGGLHLNFIQQAPLIRRLTAVKPLNRVWESIGRIFYSLLAGRCVVLARKPAAGK